MIHKVNKLVDKLNEEISDTVRGNMTGKRLTMYILKNPDGIHLSPLGYKFPGSKVWVRGDGSRYKDPGYITVNEHLLKHYRHRHAIFKRLYPAKQELMDYVWETLKSRPQAKELGTLSEEFGGRQPAPALRASGMLWVKREWGIEYSSMSRLKNTWVWRLTQPEEDTK